MIDRMMCAKGRDIFISDYDPSQAVAGKVLHNPDAAKLSVIFPPWHGGRPITNALINRLSKNGAVLEYDFHESIIEPDVQTVPASFHQIQKTVVDDLENLQSQANYQEIELIGMSLGNVALALVASEYRDFTHASLVVAGSNLASAMWAGARTQGIRRSLEKQGVALPELDEAWSTLAPKTHAAAFKGKDVNTFISASDRIIPSFYQKEMLASLNQSDVAAKTRFSRLGHIATITRFCIKG